MTNEVLGDGGRRGNAGRSLGRTAGWGTAVALILVPLVAMQFTSEMAWSLGDFIFAIVMLTMLGLGLELAVRRRCRDYTMAAGLALIVSILTFVFTGAVGIIGDESEASNMLYIGVVVVALAGSVVALFRAKGMAVAMRVAAAAQAAVPVVASIIGDSSMEAIWATEVVVLTIVFTAMWLVSAWLFGKAAARYPDSRA